MEWNQIAWFVVAITGGLMVGHALGMKRGRKVSKRAVQKLNEQSLDLLDAKASLAQFQKQADQRERKDKLLRLTLTKLQQANADVRALQRQKTLANKKHFVEMSRMHLRAAEACETARKACEIAINTTVRLDKLSQSTRITQVHDPKPFGLDDTVSLSLAERARLYGSANPITQVHQLEISDMQPSQKTGIN